MKYFGLHEAIPCVDGHCKDGRCKVGASTKVQVGSDVIGNAIALIEDCLDPARAIYGKPIRITSCYRCPTKNKAIGGSATSQHMKGEAADLQAVGFQGNDLRFENLDIARAIVKHGNYDQLILEGCTRFGIEPRWVHVSWRKNGPNRHQILRMVDGMPGYYPLRPLDMQQLDTR